MEKPNILSVIIVNNLTPGMEEAGPSWWCFGASLKYYVLPKILLLLVELSACCYGLTKYLKLCTFGL
jgi:hypothetical protein